MLTRKLIREVRGRAILCAVFLGATFLLSASCRREPERPGAAYAPIAQIEKNFGRLIATANMPTPDQNGTGDRLGLFRDDAGTIWGIPLMFDEHGNLVACASPALHEAPVTDKLPADAVEIVGAANEPTGWRGGTGKLELLFRHAHGGFHWQSIASGSYTTGQSVGHSLLPCSHFRIIG